MRGAAQRQRPRRSRGRQTPLHDNDETVGRSVDAAGSCSRRSRGDHGDHRDHTELAGDLRSKAYPLPPYPWASASGGAYPLPPYPKPRAPTLPYPAKSCNPGWAQPYSDARIMTAMCSSDIAWAQRIVDETYNSVWRPLRAHCAPLALESHSQALLAYSRCMRTRAHEIDTPWWAQVSEMLAP